MAERSGFFNARLQGGTYDRTYQAEDFADCLSLFIPNGIYVEDSETLTGTIDKTTVQGLKPYASGTSLFIKKGKAFINGYWYILDEQDLEISLAVNTTKAIALMYVAADRRMRVELLDLVGGQPDIPKTDTQYGILLGTVSYTSDGVLVTDLRTEFILGSPQTNHTMSLKTQQKLEEYEDKIKLQDEKISDLLNVFYPVGSIYETMDSSFDPNKKWGGTWERIKGRTLVGVDENDNDFKIVNKEGGEKTHRLSASEMPSHNHRISVTEESAGGHKHTTELYHRNNVYTGNGNTDAYHWSIGTKYSVSTSENGSHTHKIIATIGTTGSGLSHNNLQPYVTCFIWKRIK